ncbi:MAG: radical SAM protein [Bacteroidota bacterium]
MKIVFTHAYFIAEDVKEQAIMRPYPPLGILYLSAWLDKHGVDNEVFDTTFSTKKEQEHYLRENAPDVIAIYTNLMTKLNVVALLRYIRQEPATQNSLVVIGGPDVTYNIENYLDTGADIVVFGEGEQTMLEIAKAYEAGFRDQFSHIDGLAFREADGNVMKTAGRKRIRPVDELPIPNRHKIDYQKYLDTWKEFHGHSTISISTQRGCPYTCRWCSTAVYGQSYRRRSPASVAEELELLQRDYQPDQYWFVDDVFTVSHKWLVNFRDELQKRQLNISFECITRADRLNKDIVQVLKDCGCFRVWIGAESGSQKILDAMDRRVEVQQVREMIVEARNQGMQAGTFIMLGYPGETEEDIRETLDHLRISNPDLFTITVAYPIKGTGLYEEVEAKRLSNADWSASTDRDIDFVRTYPRPYYDFAVRWLVNGVNLHKLKLQNRSWNPRGLKLQIKITAARMGMWWYRSFGKTPST